VGILVNKECMALKSGYKTAIIFSLIGAGFILLAVLASQEKGLSGNLVQSASSGNVDRVRQALDQGASVDSVDKKGNTALNRAALMGHKDELLVERGADVNRKSKFGKTPLMAAASKGHVIIVAYLLDNHAEVNARDDYDQSALICASVRGRIATVNLLLDKGADINVKTRKGFTALSLASDQGHKDIVEAILQEKRALAICDRQDRRSRYR
jgi:ankyrin repeat protein